jgi:predicted DNA-binding transcriptional regulator AlpA
LALLTLDLFHLVEHATGGAKSWMDKYVAAGLMPLMVFLGALYRFYANEIRGVKEYDIDTAQALLGIFGFVSSCVVFGLVVDAILYPLMNEVCPPGANATLDGKCPITDTKLKYDHDAAMFFTWWWVGYPVVSVIAWFAADRYGYPKTAYRSTFKDIMYAILDVVAKGGLALYVTYRTTWV